jgi:FlaA1/EpsC-like NDP-sugar epimerase
MGEPVRIVDLAQRMIKLSGYETNHDSDSGDHIEIEYIGLRPGEKLHEELLLGTNVVGTKHPMIMRAEEEYLPYNQIQRLLTDLTRYCDALDCQRISSVLSTAVSGFDDHQIRYDHLWNKQDEHAVPDSAVPSNVKELFADNS